MRENVGDPGGIGRRGAEADPEHLVFVAVADREEARPRLCVFVQAPGAAEFGDGLFPEHPEPVDCGHCFPALLVYGRNITARSVEKSLQKMNFLLK
jgi:hypothetical protein